MEEMAGISCGRKNHAALFFLCFSSVPSSLSPALLSREKYGDESAVSPVVVRDLHAWLTVTFQITDCRIIWLIKNGPAFDCRRQQRSFRASRALFKAFLWLMPLQFVIAEHRG